MKKHVVRRFLSVFVFLIFLFSAAVPVSFALPDSLVSKLDIATQALADVIETKQSGNPDAVLAILLTARDKYEQSSIYFEVVDYLHNALSVRYYPVTAQSLTSSQNSSLSAGCGLAAPSVVQTSSYVWWMTRNYITDIGANYNKDVPFPLIFAFHGRTNSNAQVQRYYNIDDAAEWNAIIIYPSALPENSTPRSRNITRDAALFDQIVTDFSEKYCIDTNRIFAMGHSLWAYMTNSLACVRADKLRAIWSVWWWTTVTECAWPIAAMIMHNPADNLASFASWETARDQILRQNMCGEQKISVWPSWGNCLEYTCDSWEPVVRCPHTDSTARNWSYYPHTRPDTAWQMIWDFFVSQQ